MVDHVYALQHGLQELLVDNGDSTYSKGVAITGNASGLAVTVVDTASAPVAITPHNTTTFTPGNRVIIEVTVPGNIKVGWPNGVTGTHSFPSAGTYQYNWAINQIFVTGSTATFTAWSAK
jgi:hypothetical protein